MNKIIDFVKGMVAELAITEDAGKKIINYIKSVEDEPVKAYLCLSCQTDNAYCGCTNAARPQEHI